MKQQNRLLRRYNRSVLSCALASCLAFAAPAAFAQSTAATIRGQVMVDATPAASAQVTATNLATGLKRTVTAGSNGSYSVAGLPPGTYRIDVTAGGRTTTKDVTVQVGQTATLNLGVGGVAETPTVGETTTLGTVQVIGALVETKTSEIATYVSNKQIESLPQASRNFLAFADIVPGVMFVRNEAGETQLRSGAQSANNVNVFIDGVGQKNYVLQGGISGQDASKGNPFPQLAIGEFKVISQNYKAEFDQVSSAAIVAVTRSGTNDFSGSVFWDKTSTSWRSKNVFEERNGFKQESGEEQYGASLGGPLVQDVAHFFLTYEKKKFDIPRDVIPGQGFPLSAFGPEQVGHFSTPFDEDLYFGKVDWLIGEDHYFELSAKRRSESEITSVGGTNTLEHATQKENDETRLDLRYQYTHGDWLNDAHITHEDASFNPRPLNSGVGYVLTRNNEWWNPILQLGGGADFQNKGQKGWGFQDDLSFTGVDGHALKMGMKYKSIEINASEQQPYNPQFYYNIDQSLTVPFTVRFGTGIAGVGNGSVTSRNKQFGIYLQDDWTVNEHLTINLGLRWDYEASPAYTDYVTPTAVVDGINSVDPRGNGTQTYAQTLALGGININDYISNGHNRDNFKGEWQPRVGFSYDIAGDQRHVFFGGAGRSYDRNLFDWLQLETTKQTFPTSQLEFNSATHTCQVGVGNCYQWDPSFFDPATLYALASPDGAGREIDMLNNDLKTPYADQFSVGMRNLFSLGGQEWSSAVTLSHIESHDGFVFFLGNRRPDGSYFAPGTTWGSPYDSGIPGFGNLILGTNGIETRSNALLVSLEKAYTQASGWGATVAYTYTNAKENRQFGEHYALDYPTLDQYGWKKAGGVAPHRLVATGIYDAPWGLTLSTKLTLATQAPRYGTNCLAGWTDCKVDQYTPNGNYGEKRLDVAVEKSWNVGGGVKLRTRADLFNVFNWTNYTGYDDWWGAPADPNPNFGVPNGASYKTRELKITLGVNW